MKRILIASAITAAISAPAMAQNAPSFDFLSLDYERVDSGNLDIDGVGADFSRTLTDTVFVEGGAAYYNESGIEQTNYDLGVGYRHPLSTQTHAYGTLSVLWSDVEFDSPSLADSDDTGWGAAVGVRHRLNPDVELDAELQHVDIYDDSDVAANLGAKFYWNAWSLDVGYSHLDSDNSGVSVGLSYHF